MLLKREILGLPTRLALQSSNVDDIISSHVDSKVNNNFFKWLTKTYAEDGVGEAKLQIGKKHPYLDMILDFTVPGKLVLDMKEYVNNMIKDFPQDLGKLHAPWNEKLFLS